MRGIIETRLSVLVRMGRFESFSVKSVTSEGGHIRAEVVRTLPGQRPEAIQVPVRDDV